MNTVVFFKAVWATILTGSARRSFPCRAAMSFRLAAAVFSRFPRPDGGQSADMLQLSIYTYDGHACMTSYSILSHTLALASDEPTTLICIYDASGHSAANTDAAPVLTGFVAVFRQIATPRPSSAFAQALLRDMPTYDYDALAVCCWLSRDPMEELGGINLYTTMANNPVINVDGLGLIIWLLTETSLAGGPNGYEQKAAELREQRDWILEKSTEADNEGYFFYFDGQEYDFPVFQNLVSREDVHISLGKETLEADVTSLRSLSANLRTSYDALVYSVHGERRQINDDVQYYVRYTLGGLVPRHRVNDALNGITLNAGQFLRNICFVSRDGGSVGGLNEPEDISTVFPNEECEWRYGHFRFEEQALSP
ncbi:MAG: hypothetical protein HY343_09185 [Lentisphaerae bacterium]|nr:hypothetical protein [Lentisphaerota bacterium]